MRNLFALAAAAALMFVAAAASQETAQKPKPAAGRLATGTLLPVGTTVRMKLETALSTATNRAGDAFAGRVTEAVVLEGRTVIPIGASIQGHLTRVADPRRIRGVPTMDLKPETVTMPNGEW